MIANESDFSAGCYTVMDAECALCSKAARWIANGDHKGEFTIIPMQSELGSNLMIRHGVDPENPVSFLYLETGEAYQSADAIIRIGKRLGGVSKLLIVLKFLPKPIREWLYRYIAKNRLVWFGRTDMCEVSDIASQKRLLK